MIWNNYDRIEISDTEFKAFVEACKNPKKRPTAFNKFPQGTPSEINMDSIFANIEKDRTSELLSKNLRKDFKGYFILDPQYSDCVIHIQ